MLFAPALADRAILPKAQGSSYFFNRIGRFLPVATGRCGTTPTGRVHHTLLGLSANRHSLLCYPNLLSPGRNGL